MKRLNVNLRKATEKDVNTLVELKIEVHKIHVSHRPDVYRDIEIQRLEEFFIQILNEDNINTFILEDEENNIIAYALMRIQKIENNPFLHDQKAWLMDDLCIAENYRRKGYGKKVMSLIEKIAKNKGFKSIELNVWNFNKAAVEFYKKNGMQMMYTRLGKKLSMKNKLIIWDWNGTLLNDVEACVNSINSMLKVRKMKLLNITSYKNVFTFPVQDYYETIGFNFNFESFENLAVEYIDLYKNNSLKSTLQVGVNEALKYFKECNYKQVIVSASEQESLENQVKQRDIFDYFDSIIGLNNIHAKSKLNNAINYIKNSPIEFDQIVLIGDTFHDYEVAEAIGCSCILIRNGHQKLDRFEFLNSNEIFENLMEVKNHFFTKSKFSEIL